MASNMAKAKTKLDEVREREAKRRQDIIEAEKSLNDGIENADGANAGQ